MSETSKETVGADTFRPQELLYRAAQTPNGILVEFDSERQRNVMRTTLYRILQENKGQSFYGWETIRISNIGKIALHLAPSSKKAFGITKISEL